MKHTLAPRRPAAVAIAALRVGLDLPEVPMIGEVRRDDFQSLELTGK